MGEITIKQLNSRLFSSICYGENRKSQILFIFDGVLINAAAVLTSGIFLSGYIIFLKGSDFLVGMLNNSSTWASIAAITSFLIYERLKRRKRLLVAFNVVSRLMTCSIVFLPIIYGNSPEILSVAAVMVIVGNIIWGFYGIGITVMMIGLLPKDVRNQYIYVRMLWLRISFTLATISMGFVLDLFNKAYEGFLVVFAWSLVLSIADAIVISRVKEPEYNINQESKVNPAMFFDPIKNKKYVRYLIFIFLFYVCLTSASSYTPLYLIRYLKLDYGFISTINVITYILMIVCTNFWRRVERRKSLGFVIKITALFAVGEILVYGFLTNQTYYLLFVAPILSGIGYSGFNIAVLNYRYEIIPENNKTIYEGWFGAVIGLSMLISPVIGSMVMNSLPSVSSGIFQYGNFQLMYLIAAVCAAAVVYVMFFRYDKSKYRFEISKRNTGL